jgi:nucleoside 2-deoxyribosyltransferase
MRKRAYLASPLGFAASTGAFMAEVVRALGEVVEVENPWDLGGPELGAAFARAHALPGHDERAAALHAIDLRIGAQNEAAIRRSDIVVAVLDGVDVDSGTASEIGYAYGLGKRVYGLRTDVRQSGENEGALVNLQVRYFIDHSGGTVVTTVDDLIAALFGAANDK